MIRSMHFIYHVKVLENNGMELALSVTVPRRAAPCGGFTWVSCIKARILCKVLDIIWLESSIELSFSNGFDSGQFTA